MKKRFCTALVVAYVLHLLQLEFAYHMYGSIWNVIVEIFNGASWSTLLNESGDKGNTWQVEPLTCAYRRYSSSKIQRYYRRRISSDLAIDNISVVDNIGTPIADFTVSTASPCLNTAVTLMDQS